MLLWLGRLYDYIGDRAKVRGGGGREISSIQSPRPQNKNRRACPGEVPPIMLVMVAPDNTVHVSTHSTNALPTERLMSYTLALPIYSSINPRSSWLINPRPEHPWNCLLLGNAPTCIRSSSSNLFGFSRAYIGLVLFVNKIFSKSLFGSIVFMTANFSTIPILDRSNWTGRSIYEYSKLFPSSISRLREIFSYEYHAQLSSDVLTLYYARVMEVYWSLQL